MKTMKEHPQMFEVTSTMVILLAVLSLFVSCRRPGTEHKEAVAELVGREINVPIPAAVTVDGKKVRYDFSDADFKILTYIDSAGCTPCRMKLDAWNEVINEFKALNDVEVNFLMVVGAFGKDAEDALATVNRHGFRHPVMLDTLCIFANETNMPKGDRYHTVLIDPDNKVVAVGNPAINPKVRELYRKIIMEGLESEPKAQGEMCDAPTYAVGAVTAGDTLGHEFRLMNSTDSVITVQQLVPSCDCVSAEADTHAIPPGESMTVKVIYSADTMPGQFHRYVDVYVNERDNPERLTLHGFINNN